MPTPPTPDTQTPVSGAAAFEIATAPGRSFNEAFEAPHAPRAHWQSVLSSIGQMMPDELNQQQAQMKRMRHEHGASFNPFDDPDGRQAPWELDIIPLPVPIGDWETVEKGLAQRALVLNMILEDLYGPQRLMKTHQLAPEMVFPNPQFLRTAHGMAYHDRPFLSYYAADLYRTPEGRWCVLSDYGKNPLGLGYALENRIILSRVFSHLYHQNRILRLAPFFSRFHLMMAGSALTHRDDPTIVILSPGPASPFYFEHAFLSRYLSYPLVEGQDLTVRNGSVYLKKLGGLDPVDVILRCIDDGVCDPLTSRSDKAIGVAGLTQALREGRVAVINPPGSGFVDTPALQAMLPGLCRHLLNEELILPSSRCWWCGDQKSLAYVLDHIQSLILRPAFNAGREQIVDCRLLGTEDIDRLRHMIKESPYGYIGLEPILPSAVPARINREVVPQHAVLRPFLCAGGEEGGYAVMPGALVRTSGTADSLLASGARHQSSKDLWILSDRPVAPFSLMKDLRSIAEFNRGSDLPSRVADNLLWLGRYLERAEGLVRLIRSILRRFSLEAQWSEMKEIPFLLDILKQNGVIEGDRLPEDGPIDGSLIKDALLSGIFRKDRPETIPHHLTQVQSAARNVRDRLSPDSWHILSRLDRHFLRSDGFLRNPLSQTLELLDDTLFTLSAFSGLAMESITRGLGWRFMDMGRRIERGLNQVHLIHSAMPMACYEPHSILEALLEVADSLMTYRARYRTTLQLAPVLDLLIVDESNPKALGFQIKVLADHVEHLPRGNVRRYSTPEDRVALRMLTAVRLADLTQLNCGPDKTVRNEITALLEELEDGLQSFAQYITSNYLSRVPQIQHFSAINGRQIP
jgi:uncharacterized circularly permuted ATP-grasp superfamily protein/uncharacterized alpha-E superfamily protein